MADKIWKLQRAPEQAGGLPSSLAKSPVGEQKGVLQKDFSEVSGTHCFDFSPWTLFLPAQRWSLVSGSLNPAFWHPRPSAWSQPQAPALPSQCLLTV